MIQFFPTFPVLCNFIDSPKQRKHLGRPIFSIGRSPTRCVWMILGLIAVVAGPVAAARERSSTEAVVGEPFGVGRITLHGPIESGPTPLGPQGVKIIENQQRAFYPAIVVPQTGEIVKRLWPSAGVLDAAPGARPLRGLIEAVVDRPPPITIFFLFTGDAPLELTVRGERTHRFTVIPTRNPAVHRALRQQWWKAFAAEPGLLSPIERTDPPPVVAQTLRPMLARRLGLPLPAGAHTPAPSDILQREWDFWSGSEALWQAILQDRLLGLLTLNERADQPMPKAEPLRPQQSATLGDAVIEPIARVVPAECFYVRFGDFRNFLWVQDTLAAWGGDAANLISVRGLDYGIRRRIEEQLVVEQTALSRLMGDKIIADVAMIGTDFFFREGAAYGLLFQAKVNFALSTDLNRKRSEWVARQEGKEITVNLAGTNVSCLLDREGRSHSYYAISGDFHFVTTSQRLAERFLESARGIDALANAADFRDARGRAPADAGDTVFIFLSEAFFANITGPAYRIETARRIAAQADLLACETAELAARAERRPCGTLADLIAGGYLPDCFGPRPDGSEPIRRGEQWIDSVRGPRGRFLPVPDIVPTSVTKSEAEQYQAFAEMLRSRWGRPAPVLARIRRHDGSDGRQRIIVAAEMNPLERSHFNALSLLLGRSETRRVGPVPGDLIRVEFALPNRYLFFGLQDRQPGPVGRAGLLDLLSVVLRSGYLGTDAAPLSAWPSPNGIISLLINRSPGSTERTAPPIERSVGEFRVLALDQQLADRLHAQLVWQPAEPAQVRLDVADLSKAALAPVLSALGYARSRQTCLGNLLLLTEIERQWHVPTDQARTVAQRLLDAELHCPLGGNYVLAADSQQLRQWHATALEHGSGASAEKYLAPPLNWLRGLKLRLELAETCLRLNAEVEMAAPPTSTQPGR